MTNEKINLDVNESIKEQLTKAYDKGVKDGIRISWGQVVEQLEEIAGNLKLHNVIASFHYGLMSDEDASQALEALSGKRNKNVSAD